MSDRVEITAAPKGWRVLQMEPIHGGSVWEDVTPEPKCDDDHYCGECPDCLTDEHPENRSRIES